MRAKCLAILLLGFSVLISGFSGLAAAAIPDMSNWKLTFNDEFTDPAASRIKWNSTYPNGRRTTPTNNELEWYMDNAFDMSNSTLKIIARKQDVGTYHYTSGLISTWDKFTQKYGYFEMRAKLPKGKGLWPAFWLLPASKNWPPEVDIMEMLGDRPTKVYMTNYAVVNNALAKEGTYCDGPDLTTGFHTYALLWQPNLMIWLVDGVEHFRTTTNVPNEPMYVLANLAVGGSWPGSPDANTIFPARMELDYIRVYQDPALLQPTTTTTTTLK